MHLRNVKWYVSIQAPTLTQSGTALIVLLQTQSLGFICVQSNATTAAHVNNTISGFAYYKHCFSRITSLIFWIANNELYPTLQSIHLHSLTFIIYERRAALQLPLAACSLKIQNWALGNTQNFQLKHFRF